MRYYSVFHHFFSTRNPKRLNEKIQWLKLYDRRPEYTTMVDKSLVRDYVKSRSSKVSLFPIFGVYDSFDDIDFSSLPDQFVIKCTHDSGSLVICKDKKTFNFDNAKKEINRCLRFNYYLAGREWAYKNVKPRIIVEKYIETLDGLKDYKIFTFRGKAKFLFVATERNIPGVDVKFDFFDLNFKHLPLKNGHENAKNVPEKPKCFAKMIEIAEEIASEEYPMQRIDLYDVNDEVFFGEITLYHFDGLTPFVPDEWDFKLGEYCIL